MSASGVLRRSANGAAAAAPFKPRNALTKSGHNGRLGGSTTTRIGNELERPRYCICRLSLPSSVPSNE